MGDWRFHDFFLRFNQWVEVEEPSDDFRFWVIVWMKGLPADPRAAGAPAEGLGEPWWFAKIPNAEDDTHAVVCLYSIERDEVRCSNFTTLRKPL